jgi:short-subunit dehydrogenase
LGLVRIEGKRILVTGATGGLGRAIAVELAGRGAELVLSSRKEAELRELARSLPGSVERHTARAADLALPGAAEELAGAAGRLDGLVANAGLPASGKLESFSRDELERALRVNLEAPVVLARELVPQLESRERGHLVFISSLSGKVGSPRASLYSATKFGLRGFAFGLREDLRPSGVGVSIVTPGFVREAGMLHQSGASAPAGLGTTTPRKVARAVAKAIERDRSEIVVAPCRQRLLAELGYRHPELAGRVQRAGGAARIADQLAAGQAKMR